MTGRRRGGGSHHSTGSSTPTRRHGNEPGGDSSGDTGHRTGSGVGANLDAIDTMAGRLDATRSRVDGVGTTVRGVNVGPQSMGIIGSTFTGAAQSHLRTAEQHVERTTRAVDQAQRGTRGTTQAYRDTDSGNATNLAKIDTTTKPPSTNPQGTTPAGAATGTPAKPTSISDILTPPGQNPPAHTATPPAAPRPRHPDYSGDPNYRSTDADRDAFRNNYANYDDHVAAVRDAQARNPGLRTIPEEDLVAIRGYTTDDFYGDINRGMRSDDPVALARYDAHIRAISSGLNQLPEYNGMVGRGITISDPAVLNDVLNRYEPGQIVQERAFVSTDTSASFPGNLQFEINSRTGRDIKDLSIYNSTESEVLFAPGSKFKVLSKTYDSSTGTWHIVMDDVS